MLADVYALVQHEVVWASESELNWTAADRPACARPSGKTWKSSPAMSTSRSTSWVTDTQESVAKDYHAATYSTRPDAMFDVVLLARACAPADDRGYFRAAAVEQPLSAITGKTYKVPAFARHLEAFRSDERRRVLNREGSHKYYRLRFRDPLLQPYVIMRGLQAGKVTDADLRRFRSA